MNNTYLVSLLGKITVSVLGVLISAVINRSLGPELKGNYAYFINWINICINILSWGMVTTCCTYRKKQGDGVFRIFLSLSMIHAGVIFFVALLGHGLGIAKSPIFMLLLGAGILRFNALNLYGLYDIKKQNLCNVILKGITLILTFLVIKNTYSSNLLGKAYLSAFLSDICFFVVLSWIFQKELKNNRINQRLSYKEIYQLGFFSMLLQVLGNINYSLDLIFLKRMGSFHEVGIYSVAVYIANLFWLISDAFKDVIYCKASKNEMGRGIVKICKNAMMVSILICFLYFIFGNWIIRLLYGDMYDEAYGISLVLVLGHLGMIFYKIIHPYYVSEGKQKWIVTVLITAIVINGMGNCILIPKMGMLGAGIASGISYVFCSIIFVIMVSKEFRINYRDFLINKNDLNDIIICMRRLVDVYGRH